MASIDVKKGTEEFEMFADFFKLLKKYYILEDDEKWGDEVKAKVDEFSRNYAKIPVSRHLAMAILENLFGQI